MAIAVNHKNTMLSAKNTGVRRNAFLKRRPGVRLFFGKPVKAGELIFFTSQLSLMLEIGTSLKNALEAIRNQTKNADFQEVVQSMLRDVEEGQQLSDAMKRHPRVFNNVFISMVKAGETGGFLDEILKTLTRQEHNLEIDLSYMYYSNRIDKIKEKVQLY